MSPDESAGFNAPAWPSLALASCDSLRDQNTFTIFPGAIVADLPVMIAEPKSAPAVLPLPSWRCWPRRRQLVLETRTQSKLSSNFALLPTMPLPVR